MISFIAIYCPLSESLAVTKKSHRRDKVTAAAKSKLDIAFLEFMEQSDIIEQVCVP